ncbi:MAG: hypothetical protein JWM68_5213 [Verrucomicrobiales bacterium]|nr:hypothetical protein [Verrucomicrobiales bacterium]
MGKQPTAQVRGYLVSIILFLTATFLSGTANAASPGFRWVKTAGGTGSEVSYDLAVDSQGNCLTAGYFNSTYFYWGNTLLLTNTVLTNAPMDCFVTLCNSNGVVQWARKLGGAGDDRAFCAAVDAQGCCYVAGRFDSPNLSVGNITLTNTASNGRYSFFVAKLSPTGVPLWARCPNKSFSSTAMGLAVDASKNVYVTGSINGTNIIGGTNFVVSSTTASDVLLLKYDPSGNLIWGQHPGGSNSDSGSDIAVDDAGSLYLSAAFRGTNVAFGSFVFSSPDRGFGELSDIVVAKYDPNGTVLWANAFGGEYNEIARGIAVDAQHNCYITGDYQSTNFALGGFVLTNSNPAGDLFVAKFSSNGVPLWAKSGHGDGFDSAWKIAVDPSGNSYIGGFFESPTLTIDNVTVTNFVTNGFIDADGIIAKFDTDGNLLWTTQISADDEQRVFSLGLSGDALYATGWTQGTVYFGNESVTTSDIDLFVTRLYLDFPRLQYALTNENGSNALRLTWPVEAGLTFLQSSTNLHDWQWRGPGIFSANGEWTTTVSPTNSTFFRVQRF